MAGRPKSKPGRPWDQGEGSDKRTMLGVRISRRVALQLDYLARAEERSRQWVFERRVVPLIEQLAEDLWKEKEAAGVRRAARKRASPG